jgi:integrase
MSEQIEEYIASAGLSDETAKNRKQNLGIAWPWMRNRKNKDDNPAPIDWLDWTASIFMNEFLPWREQVYGKPYKNATKRIWLTDFQGIIRHLDPEHPFLKVKIRRVEPDIQPSLKEEQLNKLLKWQKRTYNTRRASKRDLPFTLFAVQTGTRATAACNLRWRDIDFDERKAVVHEKMGKRTVKVLDPGTCRYLQRWKAECKAMGIDSEYVFISLNTKDKLTRDGLKCACRYMGKKSGIGEFTPHDLRRTFVNLALRRKTPMMQIKEQGGWSTLAMVERYARDIGPEDFRDHFGDFTSGLDEEDDLDD